MRIMLLTSVIVLLVSAATAGEFEGRWAAGPVYGFGYEFNSKFLDKVFDDDFIAPGIEDTSLAGLSLDCFQSENLTVSFSFLYGKNEVKSAGSELRVTPPPDDTPWLGTTYSTTSWDVRQDIDFKAVTVSALRKFNPESRVVVYLGGGAGVCYVSAGLEGHIEDYTRIEGREERESTTYHYPEEWGDRQDLSEDYSGFYPVFEARLGIDFHVTDRFILTVEERFVNGLGTFVSGRFVF